MQYSFSYYYYLMSERVKFSLKDVWRKYLDTGACFFYFTFDFFLIDLFLFSYLLDGDGELSLAELRTLGALSLSHPIQESSMLGFLFV